MSVTCVATNPFISGGIRYTHIGGEMEPKRVFVRVWEATSRSSVPYVRESWCSVDARFETSCMRGGWTLRDSVLDGRVYAHPDYEWFYQITNI